MTRQFSKCIPTEYVVTTSMNQVPSFCTNQSHANKKTNITNFQQVFMAYSVRAIEHYKNIHKN